MMWLWQFSSSQIAVWNADVLPIHGCRRKSVAPMHWEKDHDTAYKMISTLEMERKIMDWKSPIDCFCHVVSICHIRFMSHEHVVRGLPHECGMTYWDHTEQIFILSVLPLCLSNIGDVEWSLKSVHSSHHRRAVMSELCWLQLFSSHVAYMDYNNF